MYEKNSLKISTVFRETVENCLNPRGQNTLFGAIYIIMGV